VHHAFYPLRTDLFERLGGRAEQVATLSANVSILSWFVPDRASPTDAVLAFDVARNQVQFRANTGPVLPQSVLWATASLHAERLLFATQDLAGTVSEVDRLLALPDVSAIFEAAVRAGTSVAALREADGARIDALPVSDIARARLRARIKSGFVAILPESPVTVAGRSSIGWWLVDLRTGAVTDETEDGLHRAGGQTTGESGMARKKEATAISRIGKKVARIAHKVACGIAIAVGVTLAGTGDLQTAVDIGEAVAAACGSQSDRSGGFPRSGGSGSSSGGGGTPPPPPPPGLAAAAPAQAGWNATTPRGIWPPELQRHR